ncbi:hypothetical protein QBC37DRAFT_430120 [Rhypophila decipiens]|uniref:FAD-binding PCMH-type domain-containing protein n=1 Tax=Rhypophila decipiens TaxID=261697 RepID=A0AAN6Y1Q5_9PEZI|nr:hypothetical protein QBC37DRAFT_430120 [Rhypophila decipiens]
MHLLRNLLLFVLHVIPGQLCLGLELDPHTSNVQQTQQVSQERCKRFPGDSNWPSDNQWQQLNVSLGGVLLKPVPPAAACYPNHPSFNPTTCNFLLTNASRTTFYLDDPLTVGTQWTQGNTCLASRNPTGNCTQGGFAAYVVNASSVSHVQLAVNFARSNNIRLVIKSTGHDSFGRNTGAGALSVWTHHLKDFEFIPGYMQPADSYIGPAVRLGAGTQVWEAWNHGADLNITLLTASCPTVSYGGYLAGGGHSPLSSKYGLGVDQILSLEVVTADGKALIADPGGPNNDLYFALRGGGGSTYGVVTSFVIKAHPAINLTIASFSFTLGRTASGPGSDPTITNSSAFWNGFDAVFRFGVPTADAGGYLWTNGIPTANATSFLMQARVQLPGFTPSEAATFVQPLLDELGDLGIPVVLTTPPTTSPFSARTPSGGGGFGPGNGRYASRLFPRTDFEDPVRFRKVMDAARAAVEAGYVFHGLNMAPTEEAGDVDKHHPPAVNPVWRTAIMHADVFDPTNFGTVTPEQHKAAHARLDSVMGPIREATPLGGSYYNEGDVEEPGWQRSFFGSNYDKLVAIKKKRDPGQLFWAPATVGSEGWTVEAMNGLPSQNGRLCRV